MNVLAIDSSTSLLGIGLRTEENYFELDQDVGLHHTENLLWEVDSLLQKGGISIQQLHLIVVVKGPGSFTGLRIGLATAKGLSFGSGVPLVSIPTLDVYAYGCSLYPHKVVSVMDARKNRVYAAFYSRGVREGEILDVSPDILIDKCKDAQPLIFTGPFAGSLFNRYIEHQGETNIKENFGFKLDPLFAAPKTYSLLEQGIAQFKTNGADAENEGPLYIRPSEAEISLNTGGNINKLNGQ